MPGWTVDEVLERMRRLARPGGREGMARFGINPDRALGVRIPDLRSRQGDRTADGILGDGFRLLGSLRSVLRQPLRPNSDRLRKAAEWAGRHEEFVKRAGFALMAWAALHDKRADDRVFLEFFPIVERESDDDRNFVKKAVNWSLRQIGKRNRRLHRAAVAVAERLAKRSDSRAARWIGTDAVRELMSEAVLSRLS